MTFIIKSFIWFVCLLVAGCASSSNAPRAMPDPHVLRPYAMHVVNHGWHTGIVLPAFHIGQRMPMLVERFGDAPYLEFGWGDADFYQADHMTVGVTLRALMWPTDSVMHVVRVPEDPRHYFSTHTQQQLCLTHEQYHLLVDFILTEFRFNQAGEVEPLDAGLYGDSQFYSARGRYHLLSNCNTWIARGLRHIGFPVTPGMMLTAQSIMNYLDEQAAAAPSNFPKGEMQCQ